MAEELSKIDLAKKKIIQEATEDTFWDKSKIENHFDTTILINKWIRYKLEWEGTLKKIEKKLKKKWNSLHTFYVKDYPLNLDTKDVLNNYIITNPEYETILELYQDVDRIVNFIDETKKNLINKKYEIDMYLKYLYFVNGK